MVRRLDENAERLQAVELQPIGEQAPAGGSACEVLECTSEESVEDYELPAAGKVLRGVALAPLRQMRPEQMRCAVAMTRDDLSEPSPRSAGA